MLDVLQPHLAQPERPARAGRHADRGARRAGGAADRHAHAEPDRRRRAHDAAFGQHWLGTDHLGRDLFSRGLFGTRIAIGVALAVTATALVLGMLLGITAAYAPVLVERVILAVFDIISSFPSLILALALVAVLGPGLINVIILVTIVFIPQFGRIARAQTLTVKERPFLEAERALGASGPRILLFHVLPNIIGPIVVLASMNIPVVITLEAGLSFLGVGIRPPLASWGSMLFDGFTYLEQSIWPVLVAGGC